MQKKNLEGYNLGIKDYASINGSCFKSYKCPCKNGLEKCHGQSYQSSGHIKCKNKKES